MPPEPEHAVNSRKARSQAERRSIKVISDSVYLAAAGGSSRGRVYNIAMSQTFRIAVIAGDGIGREVIPAGVAAVEAAARGTGVSLAFTDFPWGCEFYKQHGRMMDDDGFEQLAKPNAAAGPARHKVAGRRDDLVCRH